jgi:uncharacterized protein YciI
VSHAAKEDIRYVVLLTHAKPELITEVLVRAHVSFLQELEARQTLELCGPFPEAAGGMLILRVSSEEKAREIAEADPFITSGAQRFEVRRWELSHAGNNHLGVARDGRDS